MKYYSFSWGEDIRLKLRFLEIMFLISTILITLNNQGAGSLSKHGLLLFLVFGPLYHFILSSGLLQGKIQVFLGLLTAFSFSTVFVGYFYDLGVLTFEQGMLYWAAIGIASFLGLLPKVNLSNY